MRHVIALIYSCMSQSHLETPLFAVTQSSHDEWISLAVCQTDGQDFSLAVALCGT